MKAMTPHLVLAPDAAIDLQMHTTFSEGTWSSEQLIDYLVHEQFGLAAITDHDRVDITAMLQHLAAEKQLPLLTAVDTKFPLMALRSIILSIHRSRLLCTSIMPIHITC